MTDFANLIADGLHTAEELENALSNCVYIETMCRETENLDVIIPSPNISGLFTETARIIIRKSLLGLIEAKYSLIFKSIRDYNRCCEDITTETDTDRLRILNTQKQQFLLLKNRIVSMRITTYDIFNTNINDVELDVRIIENNLNRVKNTIRKIVEENTRKHLNESDKLIHDLQTIVADYMI
jgi:hypothetical protein